ncbi:copper resistance CopC family protein [Plantactinospora sp. WMMC1484]|uniref:copper resistance CopC family protein n=1 Tax=Plantactinospora sp. WMMC1484 TaxID=3404122 RepID=UPI003BF535BE
MTGRRIARTVVLAALGIAAVAGGLLVARPATAHAQLLSSAPRADSTVTAQLAEITLTFNELVRGDFSTVVVTGPDGTRHDAGEPRAADKQVHLPVSPLRSGDYRVAYRVVSADGHPVQGQFRFTVALPAAEEPTTVPETASTSPSDADPAESPSVAVADEDAGSGTGLWWIAAAGLGAAFVAAGLVVVRRQRRTPAR